MFRKKLSDETPRYHFTRPATLEDIVTAIRSIPDYHADKTEAQKQEIIRNRKEIADVWKRVEEKAMALQNLTTEKNQTANNSQPGTLGNAQSARAAGQESKRK